jgi:hypothetical protein
VHLDWLLERFSRYGGMHALVAQDCEVTYMELLARIGLWRAKLADDRIEAGDVIAIEGDISDQSVAQIGYEIQELALEKNIAEGGCPLQPQFGQAQGIFNAKFDQ